MATSIAAPPALLASIINSYAYQEFADDPNIVAFFTAYNTLAQGYLARTQATPLGIYTSPNITGALLDWIGEGVYGITRPVFSTLATHFQSSAINELPLNTIAVDGSSSSETGSAFPANDDFYKRVITWQTYIGDGPNFNMMLLRKRIARFLYGVNGTDVPLSLAQYVSINFSGPTNFDITIPQAPGNASTYFQEALAAGTLAFPFMFSAEVTIL